jgi:hypothetical protein
VALFSGVILDRRVIELVSNGDWWESLLGVAIILGTQSDLGDHFCCLLSCSLTIVHLPTTIAVRLLGLFDYTEPHGVL